MERLRSAVNALISTTRLQRPAVSIPQNENVRST